MATAPRYPALLAMATVVGVVGLALMYIRRSRLYAVLSPDGIVVENGLGDSAPFEWDAIDDVLVVPPGTVAAGDLLIRAAGRQARVPRDIVRSPEFRDAGSYVPDRHPLRIALASHAGGGRTASTGERVASALVWLLLIVPLIGLTLYVVFAL